MPSQAPIINPAEENDNDDEEDSSTAACCPICLHYPTATAGFAKTPCHHCFCIPCLERVLNADAAQKQWPPQSSSSHQVPPTHGKCPICRAAFTLFQVVNAAATENATDAATSSDQILLYEKNHNLQDTPLAGMVYVPYGGRPKVGLLSFHFDNNENENENRPYLNIEESIRKSPDEWTLDNGMLAPGKIYFQKGSHFHAPSRTFHGTIQWQLEPHDGNRLQASHEWNIVLGFAKDFRFISSGLVKKQRELVRQPLPEDDTDTVNNNNNLTCEEKMKCAYPLDGNWTVLWYVQGMEKRTTIQVIGNTYMQSNWPFYLNFTDFRRPCIQWPRSTTVQVAERGVDLYTCPMGPEIGERIYWTTSSPNFPELQWIRQSIGNLPPPPQVIVFGTGQDQRLYQRLHTNGDREDSSSLQQQSSTNGFSGSDSDSGIPSYHGDTLWGNVFCKKLRLGSASYHFLSPTSSYISYEHVASRDLPPLDDGSPLPTRIPFHNMDWDPMLRVLKATIEFEHDFGTSWNDNVRWKLDMKFDSQFLCILSGGIQCEWCHERRAPPRPSLPPPAHRPPPVPIYVPPPIPPVDQDEPPPPPPTQNEEWVMSGYGHDQLYINAAILERYAQMVVLDQESGSGSEDDDNNGNGNNGWSRISQGIGQQLEQEGATARTRQMIDYVIQVAAQQPNANPIDYNIS
jgi:hypothetical protein